MPGAGRASRRRCEAKAEEFADVVKSGRTHLMDATPVTLGQEFGGYAATIRLRRRAARVPRCPGSRELPLGGTAVGTGINTPAGFAARSSPQLAERTGLPFTEARNHFEAQGARDALVEPSGALRTIAVGLTKICNDLRWMASGPTTGLAEIHLPDLQPGSSIMPGKVNPVLPEATLMVCAQVIGNDATVAFAGASGNFELNVMMPVMARNLLESIRLLAQRLAGCSPTAASTASPPTSSGARATPSPRPSIVTPLNKYIGYEEAARVAKKALAERPDHPRAGDRDGLRRARQTSASSNSTRRSTCTAWPIRSAQAERRRPGLAGTAAGITDLPTSTNPKMTTDRPSGTSHPTAPRGAVPNHEFMNGA